MWTAEGIFFYPSTTFHKNEPYVESNWLWIPTGCLHTGWGTGISREGLSGYASPVSDATATSRQAFGLWPWQVGFVCYCMIKPLPKTFSACKCLKWCVYVGMKQRTRGSDLQIRDAIGGTEGVGKAKPDHFRTSFNSTPSPGHAVFVNAGDWTITWGNLRPQNMWLLT